MEEIAIEPTIDIEIEEKETEVVEMEPAPSDTAVQEAEEDKSSDYNTKDALVLLRKLATVEEVHAFTQGESRITVNRAIPAVIRRIEAV